jgi:hypothetical protein
VLKGDNGDIVLHVLRVRIQVKTTVYPDPESFGHPSSRANAEGIRADDGVYIRHIRASEAPEAVRCGQHTVLVYQHAAAKK